MTAGNRIATFGDNDAVLIDEVDREDGIYTVTLNHAADFNILSFDLMHSIAQAFDDLSARRTPDPNDDVVRAIVLRAEGKGFTVGLDIGTLLDDYLDTGISAEGDPFRAMWECPFPIIGAVNGPTVTGGFELALCCDVLLASEEAVFLDNHAKYGVHPGRRISQRLPQVCGANNAKLASMASYPIDAQMALSWGLVQKVLPTKAELDRECIEVARMMSRNHPVMVKRYKDLIDRGGMGTYREGLALEEASEATFYKSLRDFRATLRDGAEKFRAMLKWVAER